MSADEGGAPGSSPDGERTTPAATGSSATLRRHLGRTLGVSAVVLIAIVAVAVSALVQVVTYQSRVTDFYFDSIVDAQEHASWVGDARVALDAYIATGYDLALDQVADEQGRIARMRSGIVAEIGEDSPLVSSLDAATASAQTWVDDFGVPAYMLVSENGANSAPEEMLAEGRALNDEAAADAEALVSDLRAARADAAASLAGWTQTLFLTVIVLAVAGLVVGLALWRTLRRRVLEPIADLAAKAESVSDGNLDQVVRTHAPGEIAALAGAVDAMRSALVAQMAAASTSRAEIAEAHRVVTEQAEELRRSNRDLEQFAYVASHDLQEPLRKVASFTQLLQKRYGGQLDDRADQYIDFAVDGAKRMQRLIQDLLGFSRVGRSLGDPEPVDLDDALAVALANLSETIATTGAQVHSDPLPTVVGQHGLLVQLFQNLVGNAIKFRAPDREPQVRVGARRREGMWELWCADNGIGVEKPYLDRVFVIFQRLHAKDVYEGTGIGLALCKKIVEFHGGEIWIDDPGAADPAAPDLDDAEAGAPRTPGTTVRWTLPDAVTTTIDDAAPAGWDVVGPQGTGVPVSSSTASAGAAAPTPVDGPASDHKEST